jgi:inorganic pyrophosphatase
MKNNENNKKLRELIIKTYSLGNASKKEQDAMLVRVDALAHQKVLGILPDILEPEAVARIEAIDESNDDAFLAAIDMELLHHDLSYYDLVSAAIEDICSETKENSDKFMEQYRQAVKEGRI